MVLANPTHITLTLASLICSLLPLASAFKRPPHPHQHKDTMCKALQATLRVQEARCMLQRQ